MDRGGNESMTQNIDVKTTKLDPYYYATTLNESIVKSFDNIMFQQEKMDNKAYIFIGFLSVALGFFNKNQIIDSPVNIILGLTILSLLISLLPIANKLIISFLNLIIKKDKSDCHNIFYYIDIYKLSLESFKTILKDEYGLGYINGFENKLIEQIIINAQILKAKVFWHNLGFAIFSLGFISWAIVLLLNTLKQIV